MDILKYLFFKKMNVKIYGLNEYLSFLSLEIETTFIIWIKLRKMIKSTNKFSKSTREKLEHRDIIKIYLHPASLGFKLNTDGSRKSSGMAEADGLIRDAQGR